MYDYRGPLGNDTIKQASVQFDSKGKSLAKLRLQIEGDMTGALDVTKTVRIVLSNNSQLVSSEIGLVPSRNNSGKYRAGNANYDTRLTIFRAALAPDRRGRPNADRFTLQGALNGFPWHALSGRWPLTVHVEMEYANVDVAIPQSAYSARRGIAFRSRAGSVKTFNLRPDGKLQIQGQRLTLGDLANPIVIRLRITAADGGVLFDDTVTLMMQEQRGNWKY